METGLLMEFSGYKNTTRILIPETITLKIRARAKRASRHLSWPVGENRHSSNSLTKLPITHKRPLQPGDTAQESRVLLRTMPCHAIYTVASQGIA
jgi:hypothetical protein